jgi:hypothetical protein
MADQQEHNRQLLRLRALLRDQSDKWLGVMLDGGASVQASYATSIGCPSLMVANIQDEFVTDAARRLKRRR